MTDNIFFKNHKILTVVLIVVSIYLYMNYTFILPDMNIDRSGKHYVNDLYIADDNIYNSLSKKEKKMYNTMFDDMKHHITNRKIDLEKYNCSDYNECGSLIITAYDAIAVEHPEMLNLGTVSWKYFDGKLSYQLTNGSKGYILDKIGEERIKREVYRIKQQTKDMDDIEKVKYVYNWMADNNKYDNLFTYSSKNQSVYKVFMNHQAVCAGFAKASQIIFQNIGINSYSAIGYSTGPHMWNIVEIDGKYYNFDATVGTSIKNKKSSYYYKGLKQSYMSTYNLDNSNWYPELSTEEIFTTK